jgi:hypothetical protein
VSGCTCPVEWTGMNAPLRGHAPGCPAADTPDPRPEMVDREPFDPEYQSDAAIAKHRARSRPVSPPSGTIPCHQCGERLPLDVAVIERHVNERHPVVVPPGAGRGASPVSPPSELTADWDAFAEWMRLRGIDHDDRLAIADYVGERFVLARAAPQADAGTLREAAVREALRLYRVQHDDECNCEACNAYEEATSEHADDWAALAASSPATAGLDVERLADDVRYTGAGIGEDYWIGFNAGIAKLVERLAETP